MNIDKINVDYIMKLISNINLNEKDKFDKKAKEIKDYLDRSANKNLRLKSELLKEFLDKVIPKMGVTESIDEKLENYMKEAKEKEIATFATENNLNIDDLKNLIYEQEFAGFIKQEAINKALDSLGIMEKIRVKAKIKDFIYEHIDRFSY